MKEKKNGNATMNEFGKDKHSPRVRRARADAAAFSSSSQIGWYAHVFLPLDTVLVMQLGLWPWCAKELRKNTQGFGNGSGQPVLDDSVHKIPAINPDLALKSVFAHRPRARIPRQTRQPAWQYLHLHTALGLVQFGHQLPLF
jgi:hypothetical protein